MNLWKNSKWFKPLIIALGAILTAIIIELFCFNFQSLFHGYAPIEYDFTKGQSYANVKVEDVDYVTDQQIDGEWVEVEGVETDYLMQLQEEVYVDKLHIRYKGLVEEFTVKIIISDLDGYGREIQKEYYDTAPSSFNDFYLKIGNSIQKCKIRVVGNVDGEIESIGFRNEFHMNFYRMVFVAVTLFTVLFFVFYRELFGKRLEVFFGIFCFLAGACYILSIGTLRASWDEQVHFERVYLNANFAKVEWTEAANIMRDARQFSYNTREERKIAEEYYNQNDDLEHADIAAKQRFIPYGQRAYITQSIFIAIGRLLNMPFHMLYMFGKFGNLILYILVTALTIRIAKAGKAIIAAISLLPTSIFLASSYSYDSITIAFGMLGFIMWMNEMMDKEKKLEWPKVLAMIGCFVFASLSKGVYIALILLLCLFPKEKFQNPKQKKWFVIGVLAIMFTLVYTFLQPVATNTFRGNMEWGGDNRNPRGETGEVKQLSYMASYPITYIKLLLVTVFKTFCDYMFGIGAALNLAFLKTYSGQFTYLLTPFLLGIGFIQCESEVPYTFEKKYKTFIGALVFGVICLIWTALYMNFTVVGSLEIQGVQPRYYLPLMAILLYICRNRILVCKCKIETYNRIVMGISSFIVLYGIYDLLLKPYNF